MRKIRVFLSLVLFWCSLMLLLSGGVLFVAPRCKVADLAGWSFLGLTKDGWELLHITTAFTFVAAGLLHAVWINWAHLKRYLLARSTKGGLLVLATSIIVALALVVGSAGSTPALGGILALKDKLRSYVEKPLLEKIRNSQPGRQESSSGKRLRWGSTS